MTYKSRGRSMTEVLTAAIFLGFLVGFIVVLCVGNFYRAKRASERQRQRRLARMGQKNGGTNELVDSPKSSSTNSGSAAADVETERQHLLARLMPTSRRRNNHVDHDKSDTDSLLFQVNDAQAANLLGV
ncbi:expressed unknown protein [Seminavis robusta]|uniref:Uncharacterized protein n=1 Tax=Seminavis robusta TaxID=568900 RepID=A0A9N8D787_9STRA|nr:expressed unknown protein [Seminavis robusta]|eukprot:Sro23_g015760.1 n/a (129) ;mRNA; r:67158-67623